MKRTRSSQNQNNPTPPRVARLAPPGSEGGPGQIRDQLTPAPVLITGGAGFIGTNVADHFLSLGQPVLLWDNLSRPGVERNWKWLRERHGSLVRLEKANIQDFQRLRRTVRRVSRVFHFAAQVAVTTSLTEPFADFEVNARGTLNLLEALRELRQPPPLIFTSTNKVYGHLNDVALRAAGSRYKPVDEAIRAHGFDESRPLDFHSPYGCSKGAAEQYVLDYARTFGLPAVVFRMSCIYGPHQFGNEDQGWVAHFLLRALEGRPITIYGDGRQVRDILFVQDLVQAFVLAHSQMERVSGQAFNIGGGVRQTISLLELLDVIAELQSARPSVLFDEWRPADQQYYVSDTGKFSVATGWEPSVDVRRGITELYQWLSAVKEGENWPPPSLKRARARRQPARDHHVLAASELRLPSGKPRSKRLWKVAAAAAENGKRTVPFA